MYCSMLVLTWGCAKQSASPPRLPPAPFYLEAQVFLAKARVADRITDPLQRCLAFPDLPSNDWQRGLAEEYCHSIFDPYSSHVDLDVVDQHLQRGDVKGLDAIFAADLSRHFAKINPSEDIHSDFSGILPTPRGDVLTQRWLELDPKSPYALTARASHLRKTAIEMRGEKFAADMPPESMQRMHDLMNESVKLYQKALGIEPRLIPADDGLIQIGYTDSRSDMGRAAFEAAKKLDPTCQGLLEVEMVARQERWGGSYRQMRELEDEIRPYVAPKPLLGLFLDSAETDRGETLCIAESYAEAETVLRKLLSRTPNVEPYRALACALGHQEKAADWYEIAALVEASRFDSTSADSNFQRAKVLWQSSQPALAASILHRAIASNPNDADLHRMLSDIESQLNH